VLDKQRSNKTDVMESWDHFAARCQEFPKFGTINWIPNREDILLNRVRTCGLISDNIKINGSYLRIYDTGGTIGERKKWRYLPFQDSAAICIFYVVALSDYDEVLFEDSSKNRLKDSLWTFEIFNNHAKEIDRPACMILLLNKVSFFKEKLCEQRIPLNFSGEFPEAPDTFDLDDGVEWVKGEFAKRSSFDAFNAYSLDVINEEDLKLVMSNCSSELEKIFREKVNIADLI